MSSRDHPAEEITIFASAPEGRQEPLPVLLEEGFPEERIPRSRVRPSEDLTSPVTRSIEESTPDDP